MLKFDYLIAQIRLTASDRIQNSQSGIERSKTLKSEIPDQFHR